MATKKENAKKAREYYQKNASYRKEKIEDRKEYASTHKKSEADYAKEYYHTHPTYRKYKIRYAANYRKSHKG